MDRAPHFTMKRIPAGTLLFHGTDCVGDFTIPDGPAWFAFSREKADYWSKIQSTVPSGRTKGESRVLEFVVEKDVSPFDTEHYDDWVRMCEWFVGGSDATPHQLANALALHGHLGWYGREEILLTSPEAWLRRLPDSPIP